MHAWANLHLACPSTCLFSWVFVFFFPLCVCYVHVLVCKHAWSHERHWSLRPPHDLSYFYREVSLASPQMPPVEGESSRSGWSAVTGASWTYTYTLELTQSYIVNHMGVCAHSYTPTGVKQQLHKQSDARFSWDRNGVLCSSAVLCVALKNYVNCQYHC